MTQTASENLTNVIAEVLRVPRDNIVDSLDMEATGTWDSLSHMQLIAALEEEFNIELTADEIVAMRSLGQIKTVLRGKSIDI
ncbi:MAG TPA: acyl carrier protein [Candidatus Baltobacteraceae bacterium]|nr:acyl carrier protein [Candidatus Baltobacteraceae bacterium]